MQVLTRSIASQLRRIPDVEKMRVVDILLTELDQPDPEIDQVWAKEARKRWRAYKTGRLETVSYKEVLSKYRRS